MAKCSPALLVSNTCGEIDEVTPELLQRLVDYDPVTGYLYWKERWPELFYPHGRMSAEGLCKGWNGRYAGQRAFFTLNRDGYLKGCLFRSGYVAHRVAWAVHYGEWPETIDHINRVRTDNRLANLRSVSRAVNNQNKMLAEAGVDRDLGIVYNSRQDNWSALVAPHGEYIHLGTFQTKGEAIAARNGAVRCLNTLRQNALQAQTEHTAPSSPSSHAEAALARAVDFPSIHEGEVTQP